MTTGFTSYDLISINLYIIHQMSIIIYIFIITIMTTKIQELRKQSLEVTQLHNALRWDLKDHVSVLLETVKIKQDEIKTTLSYLDIGTLSQIQLDAKKIFIKDFKEMHRELIDKHKTIGGQKKQIRGEKEPIIKAMRDLHDSALRQWLTDLGEEQFIRMLTMTQPEIKYNVYVKEDALLQNITTIMNTDRDQIDLLRKNFNDGSNYPEDPLSSLEKVDRMISNAANMWAFEPSGQTILAMNKSQIDFLLAACKKHANWISQMQLDGHDDKLNLSMFDHIIKNSNTLIINHISSMKIEQLEYIEHACSTHQIGQSDAYKKICPTNKMLIGIQAESVWEDRKEIIVDLLKNTQDLIISQNLINDLYWNMITLLEQCPDIRQLVINHIYDDTYEISDTQTDKIKEKWFAVWYSKDSVILKKA